MMRATTKVPQQDGDKVVSDYILELCAKYPNREFLTQPMGKFAPIKNYTFAEFLSESKKMATHIETLNLPVPSQIAIMSKNCAWWLMADLAIMMTGHVGVPIYPTLTAATTKYTLKHSEAKVLFVGKLDPKPWSEMAKGIPKGVKCISFPLCPPCLECDKWNDIVSKVGELEKVKKRKADELATIVYTSGSTGVPKGVMISFEAMTVTTFRLINALSITIKDRYLSYLPISHCMERWSGECVPFISGMHVYFVESLSTFNEDIRRCKPTFFVSVPRLWTKFQQGVFKKVPPQKVEKLMNTPILSYFAKKKMLKMLGLDCVRYAASGSAPLPPDLLAWYRGVGLDLLEGYGMTENFNYSHLNKPGRGRAGYVGETQKGVEQRIAEDGEIQILSPGLMMGYFKNEKATKESFTVDGWLRTGDKGELDEMGRLKITGRTKEIFKTSKGKYIAPAPIENHFVSHPRVDMACVGGRGQQAAHVIVLLGDDAKKDAEWPKRRRSSLTRRISNLLGIEVDASGENVDFRTHRLSFPQRSDDGEKDKGACLPSTRRVSYSRVSFSRRSSRCEVDAGDGKKVIEKEMEVLLEKVNAGLDAHERLQFVTIVKDEWLPENGFVTPTNKMKRETIEEEYFPCMDLWYTSKQKVIWHKW